MNKKEFYPIDEFVSFELKENVEGKEFTIILKGKLEYADLISVKIGEIGITDDDLEAR